MPTVTMPQLGESVTEGTIGKWLKKVGEHVSKDEPIVEIITDKVNAEVPSPYEGTLTEILVQEGATVGINAGELIAEAVLALEMGADAADLCLTIHPHPTLSETVAFAAEIAEGSITDLYFPPRAAKK